MIQCISSFYPGSKQRAQDPKIAARTKQNSLSLLGHFEQGSQPPPQQQQQLFIQQQAVQASWPSVHYPGTVSASAPQVKQSRLDTLCGVMAPGVTLTQHSRIQCWQTEETLQQSYLSNSRAVPVSTIALLPTPTTNPAPYMLEVPPEISTVTTSAPAVAVEPYTPSALRDSTNEMAFCPERMPQPDFDATPGAERRFSKYHIKLKGSTTLCPDKENCMFKSGLPGWSPEGKSNKLLYYICCHGHYSSQCVVQHIVDSSANARPALCSLLAAIIPGAEQYC